LEQRNIVSLEREESDSLFLSCWLVSPRRPIMDLSPVFIIRNFTHLAVQVAAAFLLQGLSFGFKTIPRPNLHSN
jgi:hypothetical protein